MDIIDVKSLQIIGFRAYGTLLWQSAIWCRLLETGPERPTWSYGRQL